MNGKRTCSLLKSIRCKIAEQNGIEFSTPECTYQGECKGTCPKCEAELRYLAEELEKLRTSGKRVAVAGIAATMIATSAAGCARQMPEDEFTIPLSEGVEKIPQNSASAGIGSEEYVLDGDVAYPETPIVDDTAGDVAYPETPIVDDIVGEVAEPTEPEEEKFEEPKEEQSEYNGGYTLTGVVAYLPEKEPEEEPKDTSSVEKSVPEIQSVVTMEADQVLEALEVFPFGTVMDAWYLHQIYHDEEERYAEYSYGMMTIRVSYDEEMRIVAVTMDEDVGENCDA
ncbi:MAG: hypothetical protein IKM48_04065 [Clostridia bacterium]|nr:hypothetical protein [Clostridia bacterium]